MALCVVGLEEESCPPITGETQNMINAEIEQRTEVPDAAISQSENGCMVSLEAVVDGETNQETARAAGMSFVRLTKAMSPDESPSKEIGKGIYNYIFVVNTPTERTLAEGRKVSNSPSITWTD